MVFRDESGASPLKKASFKRVQSLNVPPVLSAPSPRGSRGLPDGDVPGSATRPLGGGGGLAAGTTAELSLPEVLSEIKKMQISIAKATAKDLADHHKAIVEEFRRTLEETRHPIERVSLECDEVDLSEAEVKDSPTSDSLSAKPGHRRKRLHSRGKDLRTPSLSRETSVEVRSEGGGKEEEEEEEPGDGSKRSSLEVPGQQKVEAAPEVRRRARRSLLKPAGEGGSGRPSWSHVLTEVVDEENKPVGQRESRKSSRKDAGSAADASPPSKSALDFLVEQYNSELIGGNNRSIAAPSPRLSATPRKSRFLVGDRSWSRSSSRAAVQGRAGILDGASAVLGQSSREPAARWIVYPDRKFRLVWDFVALLFIAYQAFLVPYLISFDTELSGWLFDMDLCVDIFFLTDLILNFFTGFWYRGELNLENRAIVSNYTRTWLIIDLAATTPINWILARHTDAPEGSSSTIVEVFKAMRLARLLRLMRLRQLLTKMEEHIESDILLVVFTMLKMFLGLMCFSHWIACFWWAIGEAQIELEDNWVRENNLNVQGALYDKYVRSLFYAVSVVSTMYGPVAAENNNERNFTMMLMLAAGVIFAVVVGSVTNLVVSFGEYKTEFRQRMKRAMKFMRANNVGPHLQLRVRRYIENLLDNQFESKAKAELMTMLSDSLKNEMQLTLMGRLLRRYVFFARIREELLARICMACNHVFCAPGDVMFYQGEPAAGMYFVRKGRMTLVAVVMSADENSNKGAANDPREDASGTHRAGGQRRDNAEDSEVVSEKVRSLKADDYVGEEYLFIAGDYEATGVCGSFTELVKLKRDDLFERISTSPEAVTLYMEAKAVYCITKNDMETFVDLVADEVVLPNTIDELETGDTMLMLSVRWGREPAVEVLTEMDDVAVNMSSPVDQRTPLHVAVKNLKVEIVSLLLDAGANPLILDDADLTTINYATSEFDAEGLKIGVQPVVLRRRDTAMSSIMLMASQGKGKAAAAAADAVETMERDKGNDGETFVTELAMNVLGSNLRIIFGREDGPPEQIGEISVAVIEIRNILAIALASNGESYDEIYDDTSSSSSSSSSSSNGSSAVDGKSDQGGLSANRLAGTFCITLIQVDGSTVREKEQVEEYSYRSPVVVLLCESLVVGIVLEMLTRECRKGASCDDGPWRMSSSSLLADRRISTFLPGSLSSPSLGNTERNCSVGAMRALLKSGVEPTLVDPTTGEPLLLLAVESGCEVGMAAVLLEASADPNVVGKDGDTPLTIAVTADDRDMVRR
ncbi:hypothetical protein FOZ62_012108 [Perkinsus olseni]|uniref:Cyclic nucleotide-binding domain-containing protein n=1 Tax=Perkinsus olseni TaxID=32597 RepID=A0A7J6QJX8_PEROL|nr:hypothetical protein FOZ62_012108 [Perkinsus olseni]